MKRSGPLLLAFWLAACGGVSAVAGGPVELAEAAPPTVAVALRLEDGGSRADEVPETRVMLVKIAPDGARTLAELGVESGACWHLEGSGEALVAVRCWWAGVGAHYELLRARDAAVARRRPAGEAAVWSEVGRVELPEDAVLQVLAPGGRAPLPSRLAR